MLLTRGISDEELMKVSRENPLLRFERNSNGSLVRSEERRVGKEC